MPGAPRSRAHAPGPVLPDPVTEADPTDEELMLRYVHRGDREAFEALFARYADRLYGWFRRSVPDDQVAADLVQQTFLHFHRARADFRQGSPVRPWLFTIALNVRREHFRRRARKPETSLDPVVHGEPSVGTDASTTEERLLRRALAELPDASREVILLHWYEGLSFKEIAHLLGSTQSAVKVRAHRAYKALRELLGPL